MSELCEVHGTPFISPGVCPFCDESEREAAKLRGELHNAMLAFRRIAQDRGTPKAMREIASARAAFAEQALLPTGNDGGRT
jgi:alkanesulfonate monooxygenase SsuD/methylene tetrahydromethanopterin reductase-like flavin-dependent oxidoreductase (luciferase family)